MRTIVYMPMRSFGPKKGNIGKEEKKALEKAKVHEEFEGKELDDIKRDYRDALDGCHDLLEEALASIKSGRANNKIFDDIEVKAYGENTPFCDVA